MQQTEKYKLNLIESSDPFLPDALNENTQKVEDVLVEKLEPMDARVTILEDHKFAYGRYIGSYSVSMDPDPGQFIPLMFTPKAVLIFQSNGSSPALWVSTDQNSFIQPLENGFRVTQYNSINLNYAFLAFR